MLKRLYKRFSVFLLFSALSLVAAAQTFVIDNIVVEGLQRISYGTVLTHLPVQVGDTATDDTGLAVIRALYKTRFFEDVSVERDNNDLVVIVTERPSIADVTITGNSLIKTEQITSQLRQAGLAKGRIINRQLIQTIRRELIALYHAVGHYNVTVDVSETALERNRVAVAVAIVEGNSATIADIHIIGNHIFPEKELRKQFQLDTTGALSFFTNNDKYSREKFEADLEALKSFYFSRGYADFTVSATQVTLSPDRHKVFITITVDEGQQYIFGKTDHSDTASIDVETFDSMRTYRSGDIYDQTAVTKTAQNIHNHLGTLGYAFAEVIPTPTRHKETATIDMHYTISPKSKVYVNRIDITGNSRTHDRVIRRELTQLEGALFDATGIQRSVGRLNRLGFFDTVDMDYQPVPGRDDRVDVRVAVEERLTGHYSFGITYTDEIGMAFQIGVQEQNLFGTGNKADLNIEYGSAVKNYSLSFTDPYLTEDGHSVTYNAYHEQRDASELSDSDYQIDVTGAGIGYGIPISETNSLSFGLSYGQRTLICGNTFAADDINGEHTQCADYAKTNELLLSSAFSHNTLDRVIFPTEGIKHTTGGKITVPIHSVQYYKLYSRNNYYVPLQPDITLKTRFDISYTDSFGGKSLPFYERYYTGGSGSVRGFDGNSLAPRYPDGDTRGGRFQIISGFNIIFPPPFVEDNQNLRMAFFIDAGNVYDRIGDFSLGDMRVSTGFSIGWFTPIGPFALSWAKPLNKQATDATKTLQFSIGLPF